MRQSGTSTDSVALGHVVDLDFDETARQDVQRYVDLVTAALGISGACSYVEIRRPFAAYLALDGRLPHHPDRDVALLWDEGRGWALAVETHSAEDPLVVARMSGEVTPPPHALAEWVADLLSDERDAGAVDSDAA